MDSDGLINIPVVSELKQCFALIRKDTNIFRIVHYWQKKKVFSAMMA